MSDPMRLALVGATGLVGRHVIEDCVGRRDLRLAAIARCEMPLPPGATMEMFVAEPALAADLRGAAPARADLCAGHDLEAGGRGRGGVSRGRLRSGPRHRAPRERAWLRAHGGGQLGRRGSSRQAVLSGDMGEVEKEWARSFHRLDILRPACCGASAATTDARRSGSRRGEPAFQSVAARQMRNTALSRRRRLRACVLGAKPAGGRLHMNSGRTRCAEPAAAGGRNGTGATMAWETRSEL